MSDTNEPKGEQVKPDSQTEHISVKVTDGSTEVYFKIKKTTPLRKVMDTFCKKTGKDSSALRFLSDGDRVNPDDTPNSVSFFFFFSLI